MGSITAGFNIGGFCGGNAGTIRNCYSKGAIAGLSTINEHRLGGLCSTSSTGVSINSYWDMNTSGVSVSGGGYPKSTADMMSESTFPGWHDGSWVIDEGNDYPRLTWQNTTGTVMDYQYPKTYSGDGVATPFELSDANDLISMSMRPEDWDGQFVLVQDIDMAENIAYRPIGDFTGVLDGADHIIQNLAVKRGMFIQIASDSEVRNIGLTNVSVAGDNNSFGALCSTNKGTIRNCFVSGTAQGGSGGAGGLCGFNDGDISSSFSECSVSAPGNSLVGGFCGSNGGNIQNCYSTESVVGGEGSFLIIGGFCGLNGGNIQNCYSTGSVDGGEGSGGFCGWTNNGTTENCFWDVISSGLTESDGGTPKTTEEMHDINTYLDVGWNFAMIWLEPESGINDGYPRLQQRVYPYDIAVHPVVSYGNPMMSPSSSLALPSSDTGMPAIGEIFYVEIWATDVCDPSTGLSGVYVDVDSHDSVEILSINHSSPFTFLTSGTIEGTSVIDFGGSALPTGGGICPEWIRIGWLELRLEEEVSKITFDLLPGATGIAAYGRGLVEWDIVDLGSVSLFRDCNGNGIPDVDDITSETSQDCNGNGIPDECDLASGFSQDCNGNGIPDECDIAYGTSGDCNGNGIPDECDLDSGYSQDCNGNGIPDECDIASGTSSDVDGDGVPDECQYRVELAAVAVSEPPSYTPEYADNLPVSLTQIGRSSKYYVELWAQCIGPDSKGFLDFEFDILHDTFNSTLDFGHHSELTEATGTADINGVTSFGGHFGAEGYGLFPEWVRLGWMEMRANLETESSIISLSPGPGHIIEAVTPDSPMKLSGDMNDSVINLFESLSRYESNDANEVTSIMVDPNALTLSEGNSISLDVWLSKGWSDPNRVVEIEPNLIGYPGLYFQYPNSLIFDKNNCYASQSLSLSADQDMDSLDDDAILTLTEWQDGAQIDFKTVPVHVLDDDIIQTPWEFVVLNDLHIEIMPPLRTYDLDNDGIIGLGDLSYFAVSWLQNIPPADEMHDFDFDDFVGPSDLSWFATGWGKSSDDISIVYPPYEIQEPAALSPVTLLKEKTIVSSESSNLLVPDNMSILSMENTDVMVAVTLTETTAPSDSITVLPGSLETILSGNSYVLELWVSDVGQVNSGITSVYVNIDYSADIFNLTGVSYGSTFNLFTQYQLNEGILENLGGSTLDSGVAIEPNWTRFGIIYLEALSNTDQFSIEIMPSQLGISAYGRGTVPWEFTHLISLSSYIEGDFDESGRVDLVDLGIMARSWQAYSGDATWNAKCDLINDDSIDIQDLTRFSELWLEVTP